MSEEEKFKEKITSIAYYTDPIILIIIFTVELFVMLKLKLNIDKSGILTLILHLIVSAFRVLRSYITYMAVLHVPSSVLVWVSLYYFIFEMYFIKNILTSESPN